MECSASRYWHLVAMFSVFALIAFITFWYVPKGHPASSALPQTLTQELPAAR